QACKRMEMIGPSSAAAILEMATTEELRDILLSRPILAGRLRTVLLQQPAPQAPSMHPQPAQPPTPQTACAGVPPLLPQAFIVPGFGGQGPVQMPCMFASPPGPPPMPAQPAQPPQASQAPAPQAQDMDEFWDKFSTQEQWSWNWWSWSDTSTHDWHSAGSDTHAPHAPSASTGIEASKHVGTEIRWANGRPVYRHHKGFVACAVACAQVQCPHGRPPCNYKVGPGDTRAPHKCSLCKKAEKEERERAQQN
ncbi:unnamed protein product, partial [Symbiodinium pilosum]